MLLQSTFPQAIADGAIALAGDGAKLHELLSLLDTFNPMFEIVEPKRPLP